jgi:hypothetical protein
MRSFQQARGSRGLWPTQSTSCSRCSVRSVRSTTGREMRISSKILRIPSPSSWPKRRSEQTRAMRGLRARRVTLRGSASSRRSR